MRGLIIGLEGPSGVGKTTTGQHLARQLGATFLPEAWERLRPRPSLRFRTRAGLWDLERRLLQEEARRFQSARRTSATGRPVVADTGFFGPLSYVAGLATWDRRWDLRRPLAEAAVGLLAGGAWAGADVTFYLDADDATLDDRQAMAPVTHPADLGRRHRRVADTERALWTRGRPPRAKTVYAEASPAVVARAIARGLPDPRRALVLSEGASDPAVLEALDFVTETLGTGERRDGRAAPGNR